MSGSCITKRYVLDPHHPDCPSEVRDEVMELQQQFLLHNDTFYEYDEEFFWDEPLKYPAIKKYMNSLEIKKCVIRIWW